MEHRDIAAVPPVVRGAVVTTLAQDVLADISNIADLRETDRGYRVTNYAPDSSSDEYGGDTSPGSPWDEECDRLLAEIQALLPAGWEATWDDDDICIDGPDDDDIEARS